eukprot:6458298-Amphidinium_carterae.1
MSLYGERHIRFGRLETHERAWQMLASLHSLSRTGQWTLLSAKLGQYLKALEQSVACGGAWTLAWPLTGLAPIRGGGQGLAHHTEYAAGIAYLKDMSALNEAVKTQEVRGACRGWSTDRSSSKGRRGSRQTTARSATESKSRGCQQGCTMTGQSASASSSVPALESVSMPTPSSRSVRERLVSCCEDLTELLQSRAIPKNFTRAGYAASGEAPRSMLLGAYCTRGAGISRRTFTPFGRSILHLAHELASLRPGKGRLEPYLAINVNQNQYLSAHQDLQNWEASWLIGVSSYEHGELWLADGSAACRSQLPADLHANLPPDTLGRVVSVERKWYRLSGHHWHAVLRASGYRASITLFSPRAHDRLTSGHWKQLLQLGFPMAPILERLLHAAADPSLSLTTIPTQVPAQPKIVSKPAANTPEKESSEFGLDSVLETLMVLRTHLPSDLREFMHAVFLRTRSDVKRPASRPSNSSQWGLPLPVPFVDVGSPFAPSAPNSGRRRARYYREGLP